MDWIKEGDNLVVYYGDKKDIEYCIHSADRMDGDYSGKFVCCYYSPDFFIIAVDGYLGIKDGNIYYCGGNGIFNAIGMPSIAIYNSINDAKIVCEKHKEINMIKYKTETVEEAVPDLIICDVCKKEFGYDKNSLEAQEFQHIRIEGGYGSVFGDGKKLKADICQDCFKKLLGEYLVEDDENLFIQNVLKKYL